MDPVTVKLSDSILTHKGPIDTLTLKAPKARSFRKHGSPFTTIREGTADNPKLEFRFNDRAMWGFISDMSGIDEGLLEEISGQDVQAIYWAVVGILGSRPTEAEPNQANTST